MALLLSLLLSLLGAGCAGPEDQAEPPSSGEETDFDPNRLAQEEGSSGPVVLDEERIDPPVSQGPQVSYWEQLLQTHLGQDYDLSRTFYESGQVEARIARVGRLLAPPARPASEVLVVFAGTAALQIDGKNYKLEPGSLAVLPAGARGEIYVPRELRHTPLEILVLRERRPGERSPQHQAKLISFESLFGAEGVLGNNADGQEMIHELPGQVSVRGRTLYEQDVVPHIHTESDEVALILYGKGSLGCGSTGSVFEPGTMLFAPAGSAHYVRGRVGNETGKARTYDPRGTRLLEIHFPGYSPRDDVVQR